MLATKFRKFLVATERTHLFTALWAVGLIAHYVDIGIGDGWIVCLAAIPTLLYPASSRAFLFLCLVSTGVFAQDLPAPANHIVLALFVNVALLFAYFQTLWESRREPTLREWLEAAAPTARLTLLVVYFFAIFHKLNSGFLDLEKSCAVWQFEKMADMYGASVLLPSWIRGTLVYSTLAFEAFILVCLLRARWRIWGVAAGIAFHGILSGAGFIDFASLVFALYLLFFPDAPVETALSIPMLRSYSPYRLFIGGVALLVATAAYFDFSRGYASLEFLGLSLSPMVLLHAIWLATVMGMALRVATIWYRYHSVTRDSAPPLSFWPTWLSHQLGIAVAVFIGMSPYFGFKTVSNFSMFSNLRVEDGRTNHYLIPSGALRMVRWPQELAFVDGIAFPQGWKSRGLEWIGGDSWLRRQGRWVDEQPRVVIPFLELRRSVLLWKEAGIEGIRVRYRVGDRTYETENAIRDPLLSAPLPWLLRKLAAFRAVEQPDREPVCRW